jgi:hypothetical protein
MEFRPTLEVRQVGGQVRLLLDALAYGEGSPSRRRPTTWSPRSDARHGHQIRRNRTDLQRGAASESRLAGLLYELGDVAAAGGDIRGRLFG